MLGFCGVSLSEGDVTAIFSAFDRGEGTIDNAELVAALRPPLSAQQQQAVLEVYVQICVHRWMDGWMDG